MLAVLRNVMAAWYLEYLDSGLTVSIERALSKDLKQR